MARDGPITLTVHGLRATNADHRSIAGRDLKKEGDSFHQKLNTDQLFKDWYTKEIGKEISTSGRLYTIEKQQIQGRVISKVKVNYSTDSIVISKEVWLGEVLRTTPVSLGSQSESDGLPGAV